MSKVQDKHQASAEKAVEESKKCFQVDYKGREGDSFSLHNVKFVGKRQV